MTMRKVIAFPTFSCSFSGRSVIKPTFCRSMSTSFPHGFLGFQGLTPTTSPNNTTSTNNNPRTNTPANDMSITYRPGGPSPIDMTSTMVNNQTHDIECCDSNQPLTCAVAVSASNNCGDNNIDCIDDDVPVSIAVPIYGNGQITGTSYLS